MISRRGRGHSGWVMKERQPDIITSRLHQIQYKEGLEYTIQQLLQVYMSLGAHNEKSQLFHYDVA